MATALNSTLSSMYLNVRPGHKLNPEDADRTTVYDGLVSELLVGDYLIGARAVVVATGNTSGNPQMRALTLRRAHSDDFPVSWAAASAIRFAR